MRAAALGQACADVEVRVFWEYAAGVSGRKVWVDAGWGCVEAWQWRLTLRRSVGREWWRWLCRRDGRLRPGGNGDDDGDGGDDDDDDDDIML